MMKFLRDQKSPSPDDCGFTIIESLMGIVIVAILLASISPVLVLSTAIRVQSKRIEKAAQVANTFIDGLRTQSIPAPGKIISLTPASSTAARNLSDNLITLEKMPALTQTAFTSNIDSDVYLFKKDGTICLVGSTGCARDTNNSFDEFYIQAARLQVGTATNNGYRLAIRIYRADVEVNKTVLASSSSLKTIQSPVTQGLGNKQAPLIEITVDIASSTTTFNALCSRLGIAQKNVNGIFINQDCPQ